MGLTFDLAEKLKKGVFKCIAGIKLPKYNFTLIQLLSPIVKGGIQMRHMRFRIFPHYL